jgi:dipeptidyl aminopeptidase/acylaminoacyl peptidase
MKRFTIALVALSLITPLYPAQASGIHYSSVVGKNLDLVKIKQNTLKEEKFYTCFISTRDCSEIASTTPFISEVTTHYTKPWYALIPNGGRFITESPNGRYVAYYTPAWIGRGKRTFSVLDTQTGATYSKDEPLVYWDLLTEGIRVFSFSPDSKTLVYIDDIKNHPTLYKVNLETLDPTKTTLASSKMFAREYSIAEVLWKDTDNLLFVANRENPYQWSLYQYTLSSGALKQLLTDVSYSTNIERTGNLLLLSSTSATGNEPKVYDLDTGVLHRFKLQEPNASPTKGKVVTTLKHKLSGVFLLEANKNSDTLLVWLHGGPYRQTSTAYHPYPSYGVYDWMLEEARLANVGVLKIDYPGSAGYGRPFAESITGNVGVKDAIEVKNAVIDFAKRNSYKNIYVMGNSYGGYLALKLLVDSPTTYKGAISINGVADWTTMLSALNTSIFNVQFGGTVGEENYSEYANASVYNGISKLGSQKILLVHAEKDMSVPYSQSSGLHASLISQGKNATLLTVPGEDHVFKKPESIESLCKSLFALMSRDATGRCTL